MNADVIALNQKFGIPGVAEIVPGHGGLPTVRITASQAHGEIYLHGGHVSAWKPAGQEEVLWMSAQSRFQDDKPIRGGVPICFPWFSNRKDDPAAPPHGFARLRAWELESITHQAGEVTVSVFLRSDDATRKYWPHDFLLRHRVTFGRELVMALEHTNTGRDAFTFEEAQHTYFAVADVRQVRITGLAGVTFRALGNLVPLREELPITINAETDRFYLATTSPVLLEDPAKNRLITMHKQNSQNTVVWNPWIAKAKAMPDFGDHEWPGMICIETCNAKEHAVPLPPGQTHIMATRLQVARL